MNTPPIRAERVEGIDRLLGRAALAAGALALVTPLAPPTMQQVHNNIHAFQETGIPPVAAEYDSPLDIVAGPIAEGIVAYRIAQQTQQLHEYGLRITYQGDSVQYEAPLTDFFADTGSRPLPDEPRG